MSLKRIVPAQALTGSLLFFRRVARGRFDWTVLRRSESTSTAPPSPSSPLKDSSKSAPNAPPTGATPASPNVTAQAGAQATAQTPASQTTQPQRTPAQWLSILLFPITGPARAYGRAQQRRPLRTQLFTSLVIYFLGDLSTQFVMSPCSPIAPPQTVPTGSVLDTSPVLHPPQPDSAPPNGSFYKFLDEYYSGARSLRAMLIGGLSSIPSYKWFLYLGANFNVPAGWLPARITFLASLTIKIAVNQIVFTPLFNSYFFGMQSLFAFPCLPFPKLTLGTLGTLTGQERWLIVGRFLSKDNAWAAWERIRDTVPSSWVNSCKFWPAVTAFSFTFIPVQHRNVFAGVVAIGWQTYLGVLNQQAAAKENSHR